MNKRIVIIQGHPDNSREHYCHALAMAYQNSARAAGHQCQTIDVASMEFSLLRKQEDWQQPATESDILAVQEKISNADHVVLIYPLWLGTMPALLKGFLEQVLRPGFAIDFTDNGLWTRLLRNKSVRIIVTMGMPASVYRWFFGAHSLHNLQRNILSFVGFKPIRSSIIGMVEGSEKHRNKYINHMLKFGRKAI